MRRQLTGLLEPDEEVALVERLPISGWWATTDRALYVMESIGHVRRLPLSHVSSVQTDQGKRITTIRTATYEVIILTTPSRSELLTRLQGLARRGHGVESR